MKYTIEEIRQKPEGQTFDCKSFHIEPKALANTIVAMANATVFVPCQDSDGNENHVLIFHVPASPRLHANQADEVLMLTKMGKKRARKGQEKGKKRARKGQEMGKKRARKNLVFDK